MKNEQKRLRGRVVINASAVSFIVDRKVDHRRFRTDRGDRKPYRSHRSKFMNHEYRRFVHRHRGLQKNVHLCSCSDVYRR